MIGALVPVKQLSASKSRLLPSLDDEQRKTLSLAMLRDVLDALTKATRVDRIVVVTPDDDVARAAVARGAQAELHRRPGLNSSLEAGASALDLGPGDALLVVLGDVAGALPEDLDALCSAIDGRDGPAAALAPASDGGSAALLRRPPNAIPPLFGADSAKRHREAAEAAGVGFCEVPLPSLATDLDSPEDIQHFLASATGGAHTRAALEALNWGHAG